jgi:hypothetical protein
MKKNIVTKKIKFVERRTGYKKTYSVNDIIFDRYSNGDPEYAICLLLEEIQRMYSQGFYDLVCKIYLDKFMLSSIRAK